MHKQHKQLAANRPAITLVRKRLKEAPIKPTRSLHSYAKSLNERPANIPTITLVRNNQ